jgi:hypothetical protein
VKNQTQALEHASIRQYCKATRLPTVGANFQSLAKQAVKENHSHTGYLEALLSISAKSATGTPSTTAFALRTCRA